MKPNKSLFSLGGAALIALAAIASAHAGWSNQFLNYDDPEVVLENPRLREPGLEDVIAVFGEVRDAAYLPLYTLALMPEARMGARGWHIGSTLWHAVAALLVALLFARLSGRPVLGIAAALIFAVHPVTVESVAWISGRKDQVSLVLVLAGLLGFERWLRGGRPGTLWLALLAFVLAPFAKGTAVVHPLLALALAQALDARRLIAPGRSARPWIFVLAILAALQTALHLFVAAGAGTAGAAADHSALEGAWMFLEALGRYAAHLLAPVGLSITYAVDPRAPFGLAHAVGLGLVLALLAALTRIVVQKRVRSAELLFLAGIATLLPFNNIFPRTSIAMADRYLALALPCFSAGLAALLLKLPQRVGWSLLAVVVLGLGVLTDRRTREFFDGETIGRAAIRDEPESPLSWTLLAEALLARADGAGARGAELREEAIRYLLTARTRAEALRDPVRVVQARIRLGDALLAMNRFEEAEAELALALAALQADAARYRALGLDEALVRHNHASSLLGLGRVVEARRALDAILQATPEVPHARFTLARLDLRQGLDLAGRSQAELQPRGQEIANEALDRLEQLELELATARGGRGPHPVAMAKAFLDPVRRELGMGLLAAPFRRERLLSASRLAERMITEAPGAPAGYVLRAELRTLIGAAPAEVLSDLMTALAADPRDPSLLLRTANGLQAVGRNKLAADLLRRALAVAPADPLLRAEMAALLRGAARAHVEARRTDEALQALLEALRFAPDDREALGALAELHEARGHHDDAGRTWARLRELEPELVIAARGEARWRQWQGLAALAAIRGRVERAPEEQRPALERALRDEAIRILRQAIVLAGDAEDVRIARQIVRDEANAEQREVSAALRKDALRRMQTGDLAGAIQTLERARDSHGGDVTTRWLLGAAFARAGRVDEALGELEVAWALDPEDLRTLSSIAPLFYVKGRMSDARRAAERFLGLAEVHPAVAELEPEISAMKVLLEKLPPP